MNEFYYYHHHHDYYCSCFCYHFFLHKWEKSMLYIVKKIGKKTRYLTYFLGHILIATLFALLITFAQHYSFVYKLSVYSVYPYPQAHTHTVLFSSLYSFEMVPTMNFYEKKNGIHQS